MVLLNVVCRFVYDCLRIRIVPLLDDIHNFLAMTTSKKTCKETWKCTFKRKRNVGFVIYRVQLGITD